MEGMPTLQNNETMKTPPPLPHIRKKGCRPLINRAEVRRYARFVAKTHWGEDKTRFSPKFFRDLETLILRDISQLVMANNDSTKTMK